MNLQLSKMRKYYRRLLNQRSFRTELHVMHFAVPKPFVGRSLSRKITLLGTAEFRFIFPKFFFRLQNSDVEMADTPGFH